MRIQSIEIEAPRANRLAGEKSPYLLQHRLNPVDWYPWGEEAFALARREQRPIFLSIGYSTCHWCHVMERESFEDAATAAYLNAHFVSIKVDREERPDVDKIYMAFVQGTTGQGGWPLNVFLTPDLKPFFGGTYFPPDQRHGRASFIEVLGQVEKVWQNRRDDIVSSAADIHLRLEQASAPVAPPAGQLTEETIRHAVSLLKQSYDSHHGGFGGAPKFPQPSQPALLLRCAKRFHDEEATRMVLHTCDQMAAGGIHDQLGGGFARYSVDAEWLVPHFEKMLYDNAQLAQLYLDAYLLTGEARHAAVVRDILDYVLRDMTHPEGGFFSAEDADSEGHEGKFYCWTVEELAQLLTTEELQVAVRCFGITARGNFVDHSHPQPLTGQNVLSLADAPRSAAQQALLQSAKEKMRRARSQRVRPHRDDKVLASWNGLMLGAMARAAVVLNEPVYRAAAGKNAAFVRATLWDPESRSLYHRWREGERDRVELLEGYAFVLDGMVGLYEATLDPEHLNFAIALAESMVARFYDAEHGGFWQSAPGLKDLILRLKADYDGAEPSGNSVATLALFKLGKITGRVDFTDAADRTLGSFAGRLQELPQALTYMLQALEFSLQEPCRVVVAGKEENGEFRSLLQAVHSVYQPNKVVLGNQGRVEAFARTVPRGDKPAVYLCTGTECKAPSSDPETVRKQVGAI